MSVDERGERDAFETLPDLGRQVPELHAARERQRAHARAVTACIDFHEAQAARRGTDRIVAYVAALLALAVVVICALTARELYALPVAALAVAAIVVSAWRSGTRANREDKHRPRCMARAS